MKPDKSLKLYQLLYEKLLRLYPAEFRRKFSSCLLQTFNDLCQERIRSGKSLTAYAPGLFIETVIAILKENLRAMTIPGKSVYRVLAITASILLIPLVAMQFTNEVDWGPEDFIAGALLLVGAGLALEFLAQRAKNFIYKAATGIAVFTTLFLIWVNLAVGLIGSEDNVANLLYLVVIAVGFVWAVSAKFQSLGMAHALFATAIAQTLVTALALLAGLHTSTGSSITGIVYINLFFIVLWTVSALLFARADKDNKTSQTLPH